jgi:hypothetical protein
MAIPFVPKKESFSLSKKSTTFNFITTTTKPFSSKQVGVG